MDFEKKVFFSNITRVDHLQKNNLNELLDITPAIPIPAKITENETCIFQPKCDKYYVPKKKNRMKVRTVKDIRNLFEQDNYQFIIEDMEKQQSALLKKIRTGSATDESTKSMAKKILIADHPISRTAWQMLNNINPDKNANPTQFVLWKGRRIRVVGSRGGKQKFICNYDLGKKNIEKIKKKCNLEKYTKKNIGLLRNSLNIKFKPGPLRRKKNLDVSHQKYHMSPVELIKLPKPALDIQPTHGIVVETAMSSFLNKLRAEDGSITEKWAEFAVSVLGTVQDNKIAQIDKECITFNLSYRCGQDRILMRRDIGKGTVNSENIINSKHTFRNDSDNLIVIQEILDKMLDSVEISLKQDCMYIVENELLQTILEPLDHFQIDGNNVKERNKKKYGELDRLAVTVIQLPGTSKKNSPKLCEKPYCNLGCLCDSLSCTYIFKQHCGFLDCMFGCKCEMSKYKDIELLENDCAELIPGLMKLDNEINASLAKEEQKFHQTVVVSGEKSILLKSRKRTSKSTMKYAEFHNSLRLKNEQNPKKILTIVSNKLNCTEIEPWCMVHNLYKCFCKGRFVETSTFDTSKTPTVTTSIAENEIPIELSDSEDHLKNHDIKDMAKPRSRQIRKSSEKIRGISLLKSNFLGDHYNRNDPSGTCARASGYLGRNNSRSYYKNTNQKILKMEKHDEKLRQRLMILVKNSLRSSSSEVEASGSGDNNEKNDSYTNKKNCKKLETNNIRLRLEKNNWIRIKIDTGNAPNDNEVEKLHPVEIIETHENETEDSHDHNSKLIKPFEITGKVYEAMPVSQEFLAPWLEKSFKNYKKRLEDGTSILERPRKGNIVIHLWDCLLSRYRDRKNYFLTTKNKPFRIFIATNIAKPCFRHCININAIRFADLHKYSITVKKLLTNVSNPNTFFILGGWNDCWEIIGSVKKNKVSILDQDSSDTEFSNIESLLHDSDVAQENWRVDEDPMIDAPNVEGFAQENWRVDEDPMFDAPNVEGFAQENSRVDEDPMFDAPNVEGFAQENWRVDEDPMFDAPNVEGFAQENWRVDEDPMIDAPNVDDLPKLEVDQMELQINNVERSKWFLMKLENDFTEVYCHKKGFYVERGKILHAINLARITRKTVVINNQTCTEISNMPFGIYALPDTTEYCAVVGPYELEESLGLEIVKASLFIKQKTTKGYWITTNKVDNIKVLNDPLSFLPSTKVQNVIAQNIISKVKTKDTINVQPSTSQQKIDCLNKNTIGKKIPKIIKPIKICRSNGFYHLTSKNNIVKRILPNTATSLMDTITPKINIQDNLFMNNPNCNLTDDSNDQYNTVANNDCAKTGAELIKITSVYSESDGSVGNMISPGMFISKPDEINNKQSLSGNDDEVKNMDVDIENFLTSVKSIDSAWNNDIQSADETNDDQKWSDVWIQCPAIDNLGWIRGRKNDENLLSLNFPGFKPNTFYTEKEAFNMINRILSKHIRIPKDMKIEWKVLNRTQANTSHKGAISNVKSLANNYELTESGLIKSTTPRTSYEPQLFDEYQNTSLNMDLMDGLEQTSRLLEDETVLLWNETEKRQTEISQKFSVPEELKSGMSETLQELMSMNNDLMDD